MKKAAENMKEAAENMKEAAWSMKKTVGKNETRRMGRVAEASGTFKAEGANTTGKAFKKDGTDRKHRGMNIPGFLFLWVSVCVMTAAAMLYAHGNDGLLGGSRGAERAAGEYGDGRFNGGGNIDRGSDKKAKSGSESKSGNGGEAYDKNKSGGGYGTDNSGDRTEKEDAGVPALRPGEGLNTFGEELKKPIAALADFLRTDDINHFYKAVPPDCIEFLRKKYAAAIILSGGEARTIKKIIQAKFNDYENHTGKLTGISFDISEIMLLTKNEFPEMEKNLRAVGSNAVIQEAYGAKAEFNFTGESGSVDSACYLRIIKTDGEWFIYPKDLF